MSHEESKVTKWKEVITGCAKNSDPPKKFYLTTPIYYPNAVPHIGHAYTTIAADVLARYKRLKGYDVLFLTGTDEHGLKLQRAAEKAGKSPKEFVDELAKRFKDAWDALGISYDDFIRTTEERHVKVAQQVFKKIYENGDIYKGIYRGLYCVGCENYITEKDLVDGKCPHHKKEPELIEEESYFFRLSKYQDKILELLQKDFLFPVERRNEIINRVKEGLKDISVSRTSFTWGIPVPIDKKHIMYVWIDALTNYISALNYPYGEKFKKYWPADLHLIGKDIVWFHAVIWPALLLSAGIELPKKIFAHGFWTVEGQKMSKTIGNVIDPIEMKEKYGIDAFRYYIFRKVPFGSDGDFSEKELVEMVNNDLGDELGNLVNRTLVMLDKYFNGEIPEKEEDEIIEEVNCVNEISKFMDDLNFSKALERIWVGIRAANKYINDNEPWNLYKKGETKRLKTVIYNLADSIRIISILISPFVPNIAKKIADALGIEIKNFDDAVPGKLEGGRKVREKSLILFKKVEFRE